MRRNGDVRTLWWAAVGRGMAAAVVAIACSAMLATSALAEPATSQSAGVGPVADVPDVGNPGGSFPVPAAGAAVNTSDPNQVIGTGTPASCTSAAVVSAVAAGGIITFNCGPKPVRIVMTATATVSNTTPLVVLDGGGLVTLSGAGQRRILFSDTCAGTPSTSNCTDQPYPQIVVQNITFEGGYDGTPQTTCTSNIPSCWYGGVDGGGAIYAEGGQFKAVNSLFVANRCYDAGPDLGGGAIRALAQYDDDPVYITGDTFLANSCSNGGALSSISVPWDVLNSRFIDNKAIGWGANPAAPGTQGGGSGGAMYLDGENDDTLIAGTTMSYDSAREGGGAVFDVVDSGPGSLTFNESALTSNVSGEFQNFPGIFYDLDGTDTAPVMIDSTDN